MSQIRVDSVSALSGFPPLVKNVPANWPTTPSPNKISLLWQYNYHELYHKFSPFTDYQNNILSGILSDKQPFIYTYIDEAGKGVISNLPSTVKSILSTANITQNTVDDVIRIGKFLVSSKGVQFLAKQLIIQRSAPFDETRIYNPLSPILATVKPLTLGIGNPPTRHIEGGLLGLANSVTSAIGINLQSGFQTPSSTVGDGALPKSNISQGKGLIRGGDANRAMESLQSKWSNSPGVSGGLLSSIGKSFKTFLGITTKSTGIYRADENTADLMYNSVKLYSTPKIDLFASQFQPWYGNNTGKRPANNLIKIWPFPSIVYRGSIYPSFGYSYVGSRFLDNKIDGKSVGYVVDRNNNSNIYEDSIYIAPDGDYTNSEVLVNYAKYIKPFDSSTGIDYITKFTDPISDKVKKLNDGLQKVIQNINGFGTVSPYKANPSNTSDLLPSGQITTLSRGYDKLNNIAGQSKKVVGIIGEYYNGDSNSKLKRRPKSVDASIRSHPNNLRMASSFLSDGINTQGVLKGIISNNGSAKTDHTSQYPDWTTYDPYEDDLIAFFFYDVVNKKYIPFRATVKSISEGNTAFWDELRFLGRADQLYSYNGFSRALSFSFNVVINSITELLPSWTKINYLASSVKPSNYTRSKTINNSYNKFIVPPMFMITIGDLYRFQPMVLRTITINIPEDAIWETLNEYNSDEWNYLNGIITSPNIGKKYGQLPREVEISIEGALLEKERAQLGGSHFGHAPRVDEWEDKVDSNGNLREDAFVIGSANTDSLIYQPKSSYLHTQMVVPNTSTNQIKK